MDVPRCIGGGGAGGGSVLVVVMEVCGCAMVATAEPGLSTVCGHPTCLTGTLLNNLVRWGYILLINGAPPIPAAAGWAGIGAVDAAVQPEFVAAPWPAHRLPRRSLHRQSTPKR